MIDDGHLVCLSKELGIRCGHAKLSKEAIAHVSWFAIFRINRRPELPKLLREKERADKCCSAPNNVRQYVPKNGTGLVDMSRHHDTLAVAATCERSHKKREQHLL